MLSAMPAHASFLPGFWLLVPGALGLIGLTDLADGGGGQDHVATVGSIFAIASASCAARSSPPGTS